MGDRRERSRMVFETDELTKRAIRVRAGLDGVSPADVINEALRAYLAQEIADVRSRLEASAPEGGPGKPPKRREGPEG